jgi:hypothetical protein
MPRLLPGLTILVACLSLAPRAAADVAVLPPILDATLYQNATGTVANGTGQHLFVGRNAAGNRRRALLIFDVAGQIPAGSTIVAASLTLNVSNVPPSVNPVGVEVHRVLASWGEGASDAPGQEGNPALAEADDATWLHRFFPADFWTLEGGDFDPAPRASEVVSDFGAITWDSTPELVADVQDWLDDPASNNGWILVGDGFAFQTAKRLDSREHPDPASRPRLTVEYELLPAVEIPAFSAWGLVLLAASLGAVAVRRLAWAPVPSRRR